MRIAVIACALAALLACGCSADSKIIWEKVEAPGSKIDRASVFLAWIDFGGSQDWYKRGYASEEDWLRLVATLNQAYAGWASDFRAARSPADQPAPGDVVVAVKNVQIPAELRAGDKFVTAVVTVVKPGTHETLYEATVRLKADAWGFESALNQATYNLARFVNKLVDRF